MPSINLIPDYPQKKLERAEDFEVDSVIRSIDNFKSRDDRGNKLSDNLSTVINSLVDIELLRKIENSVKLSPEQMRSFSQEKWEALRKLEDLVRVKIQTIEIMNREKKPELELLKTQKEDEPDDMFEENERIAS